MRELKVRYGTTALVTGASSGIGRAFACELAARGLDVVVVARRGERLEALKRELEAAHGVRVFSIVADLAERDAAGAIERRLGELGLSVDFLVANAGFGKWGELGSYDRQIDLDMVQVNCASVVDLTHRLLPPMKERGRGAVVIVSSVLGQIPAPWMAVYSASKAFDKFFGESLFGECRPFGVDVLSIEPTLTETEFNAGSGQKKPPVRVRTAEQVVATSLRALGRVPSVADGAFTRAWLYVARLLPRRVVLGIYARLRRPK
jgi:hypothetical protein